MKLSDKVILVDADGVLLDWFHSFAQWMDEHGYPIVMNGEYQIEKTFNIPKDTAKGLARHFNESARIEHLPPFRDAIKYVRKLHEEHGYVFHCITSLSSDPYAGDLRRKNLKRLFGETTFEKIICLDTGADKDEALLPYKDTGCVWVEDKFENAIAGLNAGLTPFLIDHGHNQHQSHPDVTRVNNWKELYEMII
jgi:beta-phosphoglucomutase-like phosphatase (HAD superfamily)